MPKEKNDEPRPHRHPRRNIIRVMRKDTPVAPRKDKGIRGAEEGAHPRREQRLRHHGGSARMRPPKHRSVNFTSQSAGGPRSLGIPDPGENLRVIPLGGVEEIGKNMTVIEYKDDIIVVDCGFQFSEEETPGVDYIIPDVTYLQERKEKIRAIFITHGHYDHIGAIPYIMERIGNPPIYSPAFGAIIIQKRQSEFPHVPPLDVRIVESGSAPITAGTHFKVRFFDISHAIPDSMGLIIETPAGDIAFVSDVRTDHIDGTATEAEMKQWEILKNREFLLFTLESTNVEKPGFSVPEWKVVETVDRIVKGAHGRIIIGTFASQVERVVEFVKLAKKYNRHVVIDGRSMKTNFEVVRHLGLTDLSHVIPIEEMKDYPPEKIMVVATGAQGEEYSVFDRIANKTHKYITLSQSDTVIFSASIIPGNENAITRLKDNIYRQEPKVVTYLDTDVHATGHGYREELAWIHTQVKYKYFMPLHGHHYMIRIHADLVESLGHPRSSIIIPDNGSIIEIEPKGERITVRKERVPMDMVMVDGFSVSDKQEVVLRDRKTLAAEGIVVVVVSIDPRTGKIRKSPDIIARGFVYVRESQQLLHETRAIIKRTVENVTRGMKPINFEFVKNAVTDEVRKYLFQKTAKSPIVIPVVIGV